MSDRVRHACGWTLLELMVVLAIAAILLSLALPSYRAYLERGHRMEAVRYLLAVAACQERLRSGSGFYDTSRCLEAPPTGPYRFRQSPPESPGQLAFRVIATPDGLTNDRCGSLSLDQAGSRAIEGDTQYLARCWGGR